MKKSNKIRSYEELLNEFKPKFTSTKLTVPKIKSLPMIKSKPEAKLILEERFRKQKLKEQLDFFYNSLNSSFLELDCYSSEWDSSYKNKEYLTTFYRKPGNKEMILMSASPDVLKKLKNQYYNCDDIDDYEEQIEWIEWIEYLDAYKFYLNDCKKCHANDTLSIFDKEEVNLTDLFSHRDLKNKILAHTETSINLETNNIEPIIYYKKKQPFVISSIVRYKLDDPQFSYFQMDRINLYFLHSNKSYFIDFFFDVPEILKYRQDKIKSKQK